MSSSKTRVAVHRPTLELEEGLARHVGDAWTDEQHGEWLVAYRVVEQGGQPVTAEIRILPKPRSLEEEVWVRDALEQEPETRSFHAIGEDGAPVRLTSRRPEVPAGGLTARTAKASIRPGAALERTRQRLSKGKGLLAVHGFSAKALAAPRRPGRRGHGDAFYAEIAAAYVRALDTRSRAPIREVTNELKAAGAHYYSQPAVSGLVHEARRRGLLSETRKGRAGGSLTDKARELLGG